MKLKTAVTLLSLSLFAIGFAQDNSAGPVKVFYIGHSLTDYIPEMVSSLAATKSFEWAFQSIPGAPLRWQWQRMDANDFVSDPPYSVTFFNPEFGLASGNFSDLVLTESVPRHQDNLTDTFDYASRFADFALSHNPLTKIYIYEVWHCINSANRADCDYDMDSSYWRSWLEEDLSIWESIVEHLNKRFEPANPVCLIPAAQGLARVYDAIEAGTLPEIQRIEDIFEDDIHLNDIGRYFIATLHYSILLGENPVGLSHQVYDSWGGLFEGPNAAQAQRLQEIALETLQNYPQSCWQIQANSP